MKFNFKKIMSVAATAVMLGSTIAAATYPAPFVQSGAADAAVVVGADAALSDVTAATNLQLNLNNQVTSGGASTITGGDFVKLERTGTDLFNMGENMDRFWSSFDESELSVVLAEGIYEDEDNDEHNYDQKIELGKDLNLSHFVDNELDDTEKPYVGFDFSDDTYILNYTLDFVDNVNNDSNTFATNLGDTEIKMLGRTYYIASASWNSAKPKLTLLDTANSAILTEDETIILNVDGTSYEVSLSFIDLTNVIVIVDGVETSKLQEGDVYHLGGGTYVAIKNILYNSKDSGISKLDLSLGSGKIVLTHGSEVEINNDGVDGLLSSVTADNSSLQLDKITLEWRVDDDAWIVPGTELVMPGFETVKLSMGGFNMPAGETTAIQEGSNGVLRVSTEITDGPVDIDILYLNSTTDGFSGQGGGINRSDSTSGGIGKSYTKQLLTTNDTATSGSPVQLDLNETHIQYFVTTWINGNDAESHYWELDKIVEQSTSNKNETTLKNLAGGSDVVLTDETDDDTHGQVKFTLTSADDKNKTATIAVEPAGSGTLYLDRVVTKTGLQFKLPWSVNNTMRQTAGTNIDGAIFLGNSTLLGDATWVMNFTEEDENGNIAATNPSRSFFVTVGLSSTDGPEPSSVTGITTLETEDGSNIYEGYLNPSAMGTKVEHATPTGSALNSIDIIYSGSESSADVFISEAGTALVGGDSDGSIVVVKDSEVNSVSGSNLIVVGGSCINSVAAKILGSNSPVCGEDFTALTETGVGQYLIKVVESPYNAAKVAMLVAGYQAADTTNAVAKVKEGVNTDAGSSNVYPMASA